MSQMKESFGDPIEKRYPEQIKLLISMVRMSRLGGIATAECDDLELRERLFRYFEKRFREMNIYLYPVEITEEDLNLVRVLRNLTDRSGFKELELMGKYENIVFFVYGLEKLSEEQQEKFLLWLNLFRDATTIIRQPIVLWATSDFVDKMAKEAPDFWTWKGMLFRFESLPTGAIKRAKLPPLKRYLQGILEDPDFSIWNELYVPLRAMPVAEAKIVFPAFLRRGPAVESQEVISILEKGESAALLGEPGAGKTTVVKRLTWLLARKAWERYDEETRRPLLVPVFIRLHQLRKFHRVEELVLSQFHTYGLKEIKDLEELDGLLRNDPEALELVERKKVRFLFILDGLNEMPAESKPALDQFLHRYRDHRFIITSRFYDESLAGRFPAFVLQELKEEDIDLYIITYLGEEKGRKFAQVVKSDTVLKELASNPLALYMLTRLSPLGEEPFPRNRGLLFQRFAENLLRRTESEWWTLLGRTRGKVAVEVSWEALAYLGLTMQRERAEALPRERVYWLIRETTFGMNLKASAQEVLEGLLYSGLLRLSRERDTVEFMHHAVREYFAALGLLKRGELISWYLTGPEDIAYWSGVAVCLFGLTPSKAPLYREIVQDGADYNRLWLAALCLSSILYESEELGKLETEVGRNKGDKALFQMVWGMACELAGDFIGAIEHLEEALRLNPDLYYAYYELAWIRRILGQGELAIEALKKTLEIAPTFVDAYNLLGILYYEQGDYAKAIVSFLQATSLEAGNPHHYYNLGLAYKALGEYERAAGAFKRAFSLKPDYEEARVQLELVEKALATSVLPFLKQVYFLRDVPLEKLLLLAERLKPVSFSAGEIIIRQGDIGSTFYLISEGKVEVYIYGPEGRKVILSILGPGSYFGEIALLEETPVRTAWVMAVTPVKGWALEKEDFDEVMATMPSAMEKLVQTRNERLQRDISKVLEEQASHSSLAPIITQPKEGLAVEPEQALTILVADIQASTQLATILGPRAALRFLREFYLMMAEAVGTGGMIRQYTGDQILVVFQEPGEALKAASRMQKAFSKLIERWLEKYPELREHKLGIGISTGSVAVDTIWSESIVAGYPVILASRLSARSKPLGEILIDEATAQRVKDKFPLRLMPSPLIIKGFETPIKVYKFAPEEASVNQGANSASKE